MKKYTLEGRIVEIKEMLENNKYLISYVYEYGESDYIDEEIILYDGPLFDTPPTIKYDDEIKKLRKQQELLEEKINKINEEYEKLIDKKNSLKRNIVDIERGIIDTKYLLSHKTVTILNNKMFVPKTVDISSCKFTYIIPRKGYNEKIRMKIEIFGETYFVEKLYFDLSKDEIEALKENHQNKFTTESIKEHYNLTYKLFNTKDELLNKNLLDIKNKLKKEQLLKKIKEIDEKLKEYNSEYAKYLNQLEHENIQKK